MKKGNFVFTETFIKGVFVIETIKYGDERGFFSEIFREDVFREVGILFNCAQENMSFSVKGVLRGLHFQKEFPQAKLARCVEGEVFDVCVDLRPGSKTFGKWFGVVLSSQKGNMLLIPKGMAHGVLTLSENAVFSYKCDDTYHPNDEGGIMWNDPTIGIKWPIDEQKIILSEKDKKWPDMLLVKSSENYR